MKCNWTKSAPGRLNIPTAWDPRGGDCLEEAAVFFIPNYDHGFKWPWPFSFCRCPEHAGPTRQAILGSFFPAPIPPGSPDPPKLHNPHVEVSFEEYVVWEVMAS